jgi:plastocyanin
VTNTSGLLLTVAAVTLLSTSTSSVMAEVIRVEVKKLAFSQAETTARVGDTIEWINDDFIAHTATAKDNSWDVVLEPGKIGRLTLKKVGTIEYFCRFHPNMKGRLSVTN